MSNGGCESSCSSITRKSRNVSSFQVTVSPISGRLVAGHSSGTKMSETSETSEVQDETKAFWSDRILHKVQAGKIISSAEQLLLVSFFLNSRARF